MTTPLCSRSSWLASMAYKRTPDGASYLAFFLKTEPGDEPKALLFGPKLPSWLPGLIAAGTPTKESREIRHSPGRAYHRLVKGKYPCQVVTGEREVEKLKEMMK